MVEDLCAVGLIGGHYLNLTKFNIYELCQYINLSK